MTALDIPLLDRIRRADGSFVPWTALAADPTAARAAVAALVDFGFAIEPDPARGVAYRGPSPRLCPDQIEHDLGTRVVGRRLAVWNRVASTNDLAMQAAASRSNHGLAILAEEQTAGRGSRGRAWTAPPRSSILLSVLLFPPPELDDPVWLNAFAALAVAAVAHDRLGTARGEPAAGGAGRPAVTIKWPNDVLIAGKKVAGILVERGKGTVIGIGLNANIPRADFPEPLRATATSLAAELGEAVDRSDLARQLLRALDSGLAAALDRGPAGLVAGYRRYSDHIGREVEVATEQGPVVGRLQDFDLGAGLKVGASRRSVATIPVGRFSAIANRPGSTYWTRAEQLAWHGLPPDAPRPPGPGDPDPGGAG